MLVKCLLHRMQRAVLGEAFDGDDSAPSAWTANIVQDFTATPVHMHDAGAALRVSQPTWVPVRCELSRRNSTSSVAILDLGERSCRSLSCRRWHCLSSTTLQRKNTRRMTMTRAASSPQI